MRHPVTAKFQNGVIFIKFQKLALNYVGQRSINGKLFFEKFEIFGTTLMIIQSVASNGVVRRSDCHTLLTYSFHLALPGMFK